MAHITGTIKQRKITKNGYSYYRAVVPKVGDEKF